MGPCDYAKSETPDGYRCVECGKRGVKLWCDPNMQHAFGTLECVACALVGQEQDGPVDDEGYRIDGSGQKTLTIGWRVPAVPTADGKGFHHITTITRDAQMWWHRIPTNSSPTPTPTDAAMSGI